LKTVNKLSMVPPERLPEILYAVIDFSMVASGEMALRALFDKKTERSEGIESCPEQGMRMTPLA
jgi:hypothetical protein